MEGAPQRPGYLSMKFADPIYNNWAKIFTSTATNVSENRLNSDYTDLLSPSAAKLHKFFLLAQENGTRSLAEWKQQGYSDVDLTAIVAIGSQCDRPGKFNADTTFTQKF